MKVIEKYVAFDGKEFASEAECLWHEREQNDGLLLQMDREDLEQALNGGCPKLADAIERFARKITVARLERGERKRRPKGTGQAVATGPEIATTS